MPAGLFINHFTAVRMRVTGSGNLQCRLLSLDEDNVVNLPNIVMTNAPGRYTNILCNMLTQRAQLEIKTTEINEVFNFD
jgi:hypothetical protein